ncbi:MAG: nucleoside deaminase [Planctomycetes bacterium]|nr:nucleoside deaminase [Planctomycetota bacterium]
MRSALLLAHTAAAEGEVPVGCVVVHDGRIIARAYNQRELLADPTAHAEMIALTQAAAALGSWRLDGASLYVTLEPCAMCAGAIIQARVPRLVFAAADPKAGAAGSVVDLFEPGLFNHDVEVVSGVLAAEAASLLSAFFRNLRR